MEWLNSLAKTFVELWPMMKADGSFLFLILVVLFCALLLMWGIKKRREDQENVKKLLDQLRTEIQDLQAMVDLLTDHHCVNHEEHAKYFRKKLRSDRNGKVE